MKKPYGIKIQTEIKFKNHTKRGKITKIIKGSKTRRGLTQVKDMLLQRNKQEILIYYDNKEIHAKKYCF